MQRKGLLAVKQRTKVNMNATHPGLFESDPCLPHMPDPSSNAQLFDHEQGRRSFQRTRGIVDVIDGEIKPALSTEFFIP